MPSDPCFRPIETLYVAPCLHSHRSLAKERTLKSCIEVCQKQQKTMEVIYNDRY